MYGILAKNRGMWGCTVWCKRDGEIELYKTKEEAQKVADERNNRQVNRFTDYFVSVYEE